MTELSFAGYLMHSGFYKFGYVTNDREAAIEVLTQQLGVEEFVRFEPSFPVLTSDGRRGSAHLRCAFSAGRELCVEILQPIDGLVDVWSEFLSTDDEFQLVFHHTAILVDDLAAVKKAATDVGLTPALESHLPSGMSFTYIKLPALGHYVEHDQYDGNSREFLDSVRNKKIGAA